MTSASKNIVAELNKGEKLNSDNYDIWHRMIQYILEEQETLEALNNTLAEPEHGNTAQHRGDLEAYQAWKKKNSNARITMLNSMQYDLMCEFEKYETTQEMWLALKDKFGGTSIIKLKRLTIKFDSYRTRQNHTIRQHLREMSNMICELKVNMTHNESIRAFNEIDHHLELEVERLEAAKHSDNIYMAESSSCKASGFKRKIGHKYNQKGERFDPNKKKPYVRSAQGFDPEIERTARRLRGEHRELQAAITMDDLQDLRNLKRREEIQPVNVHEDCWSIARSIAIRLFPFSLRDRARAWLNSLLPDSITTWNDLADKLLMKYFPPTKNAKLRNEITSFHQLEDESLCDAWERFKELLRKCPHHGIPYCIQLGTFYNALNPSTRLMVDASVNGALLSKSYNEAYEILERIANNNYQWPSTRQAAARGTTRVHNVNALTALSAQVTSLTKMIKAMTIAPATVNQIYDMSCIYCGEGHLFDNCPGNPASVNYVGNFNRQNQDNLYSNTYNPGWRQYSNFSLNNQNQHAASFSGQNRLAQPSGFYQQNQEQRSINNDQLSSLKGLIKDYIVKNEAVVQSHIVSLRNLENQIGQLATAISNRLQGSLPSNIENPRREGKEHCKVISLRSVKDVDNLVGVPKRKAESTLIQKETQSEKEPQSPTSQHADESSQAATFAENDDPTPVDNESKIPQKMKDPGSFTIPCSIGTKYSGKALCDLGASINLMPLSVFNQLGVGECRPTTVTLQLADRSHAYPKGKIEDVVVDFVVAERLHSCCSKEEINAVTFEELDDEDHEAANMAWSREKQPFRIDEQIQQRELTPDQQEFKVNGPKVKHYIGDDVNSLKNDRFLKDPG
ncbi:hypothetical protein KPL71_026137 [Citrus sinensis]|uniref:Uncharacterized protein n=1 Tax=Citrus sinensis TaxID=2711 RepID=A0ACB8HYY6_CITSI|nr:hypothetical protein KPL71_026137 [Citrus sinensis]